LRGDAVWLGWIRRRRQIRNADVDGKLHFPGADAQVAQYLLDETSVVGLAVDTLSLDAGNATDLPTHRIWLPAGRWGLECVANLDEILRVVRRLSSGRQSTVAGLAARRGCWRSYSSSVDIAGR